MQNVSKETFCMKGQNVFSEKNEKKKKKKKKKKINLSSDHRVVRLRYSGWCQADNVLRHIETEPKHHRYKK